MVTQPPLAWPRQHAVALATPEISRVMNRNSLSDAGARARRPAPAAVPAAAPAGTHSASEVAEHSAAVGLPGTQDGRRVLAHVQQQRSGPVPEATAAWG
jgi:hypothetical protein